MTNHVIQETFFPAQLDCNSRRIPDYAKMHKELAKPGVTAIVNINLIHWPSKSDPLALA